MYEPVIGLEVHAELQTQSKMFCGCQVVDSTQAAPNIAVCPVCAGMPGMLPVANRQAVTFGLKVALALGCQINPQSIFARKNYFYPDLPKGYQISQYEQPLAHHGRLNIAASDGFHPVRIRRVHLEEDTGKLTHVGGGSLIDLNRAGVPLLEIVSEPDIRSAEQARLYAEILRDILRYLGVNSGDMQKGVMRIEPNVSVRRLGDSEFGTRTEIKNLNSFRALERGIEFEIHRQVQILEAGGQVRQETVGWDENQQVTFIQRVKEGEEDYRYFPEPDLPPLVVDQDWIASVKDSLPELPEAKRQRFQDSYELTPYLAQVLTAEQAVADYFESVVAAAPKVSPKTAANWIAGELYALMNTASIDITAVTVSPPNLGALLALLEDQVINQQSAKIVLGEMFSSSRSPHEIVETLGLIQISDQDHIAGLVTQVLDDNPHEVQSYRAGKHSLSNWFFGQVMRAARGKANPQVIRAELDRQLARLLES